MNIALAHLKLANQQLVQATSGIAAKFLEYENSTFGIKIHYPSDSCVEGASNSSIIAAFYPQRNYANY